MGFFSWTTADKQESIANIHSNHPNKSRTVYLLQPEGAQPIAEAQYDGYGVFGGIDAYEWLANNNFSEKMIQKAIDNNIDVRNLGITALFGKYFTDRNDGEKFFFSYDDHNIFEDLTPFVGDYATIQPKYGKTPNELIKEGVWVECDFSEFLYITKPLKFSHDKFAKYEDFPKSEICPKQGFFYSEDEEVF